jgi:parvulin-like peptidyl-prolyl isomerase
MRVMNAPENRSVFTKYFRDLVEMLPKEKFRIDVMAAYRVTNGEAEEGARTRETRWQATGLLFGSQAVLQKLEPGEAELKAYYEKNKEDYRTKETRDLGYVSFPIVVTARDSQDAKEVIDKAHNQLAAGETFNITALDFSELELDSSGRFFAKARLDPATDTIVSRLKPGTYSSPFLTNYGWQIVMLDSTRPDSIALRRILVRVKQGAEELAALRDSVRNFIDRARTGNFDTVAAEFGLSVIRTRPMVGGEGNFSALGLESPSALTEWAKRARRGDVMESPVRGQPGYMVFHLVDIRPAGFQEYEKVKPAVSWKVRQELEKAVWSARAESAWIQVKAGKTMEQVAQEMPGVEFFAGEDYGSLQDARMRRGAEFAGALSVLNPGEKTGVVTTAWGAYIIRCDERVAGAAANPGAFAQERQQQVAQQLMQELLKEPEVADYRDGFSY